MLEKGPGIRRVGARAARHQLAVEPLHDLGGDRLARAHAELEPRCLPDQLPDVRLALHAGQVDDDAVIALLLDHRLRNPELVDPVAKHLDHAIERVLRLVGRHLGQIRFEDHVHPPLQIEPHVNDLRAQILGGEPLLGSENEVVLVGRIQVIGGQPEDGDQEKDLPACDSTHVRFLASRFPR